MMDTTETHTANHRKKTKRLSFDARPDSTETVSRVSSSSSRPTSSSLRPQTSSSVIFPPIQSHSFPYSSPVNVWFYSNPAAFRLSRQNNHTSPVSLQPAKRRRFFSSLPSLIRPNEGSDDTLRRSLQSDVSTFLDGKLYGIAHINGGTDVLKVNSMAVTGPSEVVPQDTDERRLAEEVSFGTSDKVGSMCLPKAIADLKSDVVTDGLVWRFMNAYPGNSRYALLGYETHHNDANLVMAVYDLLRRETIRSAKVPYERYQLSSKKLEIGPSQFLDDVHVVLPLAGKLFILNLDTMKIEGRLDDALATDSNVAVVYSRGQEVLTFTEGRKNIQICEVSAGKTTAILETNMESRYDAIFVNQQSKYCIATTDTKSRKAFAFDLERRSVLTQVDLRQYMKDGEILEQPVLWSNDGCSCILFVSGLINKELQEIDTKLMDSFKTLIVWNVVEGALTALLLDWQHMLQYCLEERRSSAEPTTAVILANDGVLCGCADFLIRAFTIKGELLYRLEGHQGLIDHIYISRDQTRCLTQSRDADDLACILWDLEARRKVAMFIFDKDPGDILSVGNGSAIVFHTDGPDLKFINLVGDAVHGYMNDIKDEAEFFKGKVLDEQVDPLTDEELALHRATDDSDDRVKEDESVVLSQEKSDLDLDNIDEWRQAMSSYMQSDNEEAMDDEVGKGPSETSGVHLNGGLTDEVRGLDGDDDDDDEGYYFIDGRPVPVREVRARSKQLVDDVMADVDCSDWSDRDFEENDGAGQDGVSADDDEGAYYFVDGKPIPASTIHGQKMTKTGPVETMLSSADGDDVTGGLDDDMDTDEQMESSHDDDEGFVFLNGKMVPVKEARGIHGVTVGVESTEWAGDIEDAEAAFVDKSAEAGSHQVPDSEILSDDDDIR